MDLHSLQIDRGPATTASPARRRRSGPWPLRFVLLLLAAALAWLFWPMLAGFSDRIRLPEVKTMLVAETSPAAAAAVSGTAANGYIVAARRAALSSDVPGRIVELNVKEGSVVKRGEVVARLYADEYRAALERARADTASAAASVRRAQAAQSSSAADERQAKENVATAMAALEEARAQQRWATAEFRRVDDLVRGGIGSPRDLDRAQSDLDAARSHSNALEAAQRASAAAAATAAERVLVAAADCAVAEAQQRVAEAAQQQAQTTLDKTDVKAPFDGIVVLKDAEVGEVVSPNVQGGGNARGAVCTMVDFESLEVQANVPETSLSAVKTGAAADVVLDARPDHRYQGVVDRIWPTADRQKATVEVRIRLLQRDDQLRPEMGVRVTFAAATGAAPATTVAGEPGQPLIVVPETALVEIAGKTGAFVLERDVAHFTPVRTGDRKNGRVAVLSGLQPGHRLVLEPPNTLQDGQRVRFQAN